MPPGPPVEVGGPPVEFEGGDAYDEFCQEYGSDVTEWEGFELLRDARELRITCWMAQLATENPQAQEQAALRVACLRGNHGARPWPWKPIF